MKLEFCRQILEKCLNNKFELMKLRVAFRNFVNTPKNPPLCPHSVFICFVWSPKQSDIISELRIQRLVHVLETVSLLRGENWLFKYSIHSVQRGSGYNYRKGYNQFNLRQYEGYLPPHHTKTVSVPCTNPVPVVERDCSGKRYTNRSTRFTFLLKRH